MKDDEIKNNYQAYWDIYKNRCSNNKYVLANTMRNILEYFFSFIDYNEYSNVVSNLSSNIKYKSFLRFINRNSHSDLVNMDTTFDNDAINIDEFIVTFKEIFKTNEVYKKHYKKMSGENL